jgi:hypothetical protein
MFSSHNARVFLRKLRGGSQAHLIETEDGQVYVVKFLENPQHRRILINELVAAQLLEYLGIIVPDTALIWISQAFLVAHPEVGIQLGSGRIRVAPGWHFGCRYPGHPNRVAVYDVLPDPLLQQVVNRTQFVGMLVFDKWVCNTDGRQAIFFRAEPRPGCPRREPGPVAQRFVASMIDHGFAFNGPSWDFPDGPLHGLYHRPLVYAQIRGWGDFDPWLVQIRNFPEEVVDQACQRVPLRWLASDADALRRLRDQLLRRRCRVADLIDDCRRARPELFPNWCSPRPLARPPLRATDRTAIPMETGGRTNENKRKVGRNVSELRRGRYAFGRGRASTDSGRLCQPLLPETSALGKNHPVVLD